MRAICRCDDGRRHQEKSVMEFERSRLLRRECHRMHSSCTRRARAGFVVCGTLPSDYVYLRMYVCACVCICVYVYVYVLMYICRCIRAEVFMTMIVYVVFLLSLISVRMYVYISVYM